MVDQVVRAKGLLRDELTPRGLRIAAGLSIQDLASKSGVSANAISSIECGKTRDPAPGTTAAIAGGLGIGSREYREAVARMEGKQEAR